MTIPSELDRAERINSTLPVVDQKGRIAVAAERLSRRGIAAAKAELANAALAQLAKLVYEADTDGEPANFDAGTNRLLMPLPWGRKGCHLWGVRVREARILSHIMLTRADAGRCWLSYDRAYRCWYINAAIAPTYDAACEYLWANPITPGQWRAADAALATAWAKDRRRLSGD